MQNPGCGHGNKTSFAVNADGFVVVTIYNVVVLSLNDFLMMSQCIQCFTLCCGLWSCAPETEARDS